MPWRRAVIIIAAVITLFGYVRIATEHDVDTLPADATLVTRAGKGGVRSVVIAADTVLVSHSDMITAYSLPLKKVSWQRAGKLRALAGDLDDVKLVLGDDDRFQILDLARMTDPKYASGVASLPGQAVWAYSSMVIAATCGEVPPCQLTRYDLTERPKWSVKVPGTVDASVLTFPSELTLMMLPTDDGSALVLKADTGDAYDVFSTAKGQSVRQVGLDANSGEILDRDGEDLVFVRSSWSEGQCHYDVRSEAVSDTKTLWHASDRDLGAADPRWGCVLDASSVLGGNGLLRTRWGDDQELLLNVSNGKTVWSSNPHEHVLTVVDSTVIVSSARQDAVAFDDLSIASEEWHKTPGKPRMAWTSGDGYVVEASDGTLVNVGSDDHVIDPIYQVLAAADQGAIVLRHGSDAIWLLPYR